MATIPIIAETRTSAMKAAFRMLGQIAPRNIPILITGENGTGKTFLAQQIHNLSPRRSEVFAHVKCASLGAGSFATYFEKVGDDCPPERRTGSLFLREISELELSSQRDLLYALSDAGAEGHGSYGGPRLISSTAVQLEEEMRVGRFRAELYYRINGARLHLPALRQRKEDIPALAELFLSRYANLLAQTRPQLDGEDLSFLQEYSWPGNIGELENVIKKMAVSNNPKAVIAELHANSSKLRTSAGKTRSLSLPLKVATRAAARGAEREMILAALGRNRWNRKRAAAELKISYKSLLCKLKLIGPELGKI